MKCLLCKSDSIIDSTSTYFAQHDNCYVIIENVPCKKCSQCGDVVYSASVMERIDDILDKLQNIPSVRLPYNYLNFMRSSHENSNNCTSNPPSNEQNADAKEDARARKREFCEFDGGLEHL